MATVAGALLLALGNHVRALIESRLAVEPATVPLTASSVVRRECHATDLLLKCSLQSQR